MNQPGEQFGRPITAEKHKIYVRDEENTMMYRPGETSRNKFFGRWSYALALQQNLFHE